MNWRKTHSELLKLDDKKRALTKKLESEIKPLCEFNVGVTEVGGDGILLIDCEDATVALFEALTGVTEKKKLTRDEFEKFTL